LIFAELKEECFITYSLVEKKLITRIPFAKFDFDIFEEVFKEAREIKFISATTAVNSLDGQYFNFY